MNFFVNDLNQYFYSYEFKDSCKKTWDLYMKLNYAL